MNELYVDVQDEAVVPMPQLQRPTIVLFGRAWQQARTKIGVGIVGLLILTALIGPFFAPHSPSEFVAAPFAHPSGHLWLGADDIGRDVLSRFLWGGRSVLGLAFLATAIGVTLGVTVGLVAAYSRGTTDDVLMRATDVLIAFPPIVFALVAIATVGPQIWLLILAASITTAPRVARVTRGVALEVVERDFVRAAEAIGVKRTKILFSEVLPNIMSPLVVDASLRLTYCIGLIAGLSFLGFGLRPPAADWGLMINENDQGLAIQPWGVVAPIAAIALLTIGTSLIGDGFARATAGIERGSSEG